jgi:type VI secretion system FHA domain protein
VVPTGYIPGSVQFDETSGGALFPESSPEPEDPFASTSSAGEAPAEPPITGEAEEARPEQARPAAKAREPAPVTTPSALVMQKAGPAETVFGQAEKDLLEALLKGLGSSALKVSPDEAASFAVQIGQLVHEAVQGLIDTLRLRDEFKREFYVPVTRIAPTDNNLFKHSANVDDALARAFSGVGAAYLGPAESTRQAFQDIAAHHLALVAGMQAAIGSLLERFSPQALEQRIGKTTMLDGVLPQIRKAHMWEQFEKEYGQIAEQAEEDFQRVFGQQFERAYTQEILRLHSAGFGGSGREKED